MQKGALTSAEVQKKPAKSMYATSPLPLLRRLLLLQLVHLGPRTLASTQLWPRENRRRAFDRLRWWFTHLLFGLDGFKVFDSELFDEGVFVYGVVVV